LSRDLETVVPTAAWPGCLFGLFYHQRGAAWPGSFAALFLQLEGQHGRKVMALDLCPSPWIYLSTQTVPATWRACRVPPAAAMARLWVAYL